MENNLQVTRKDAKLKSIQMGYLAETAVIKKLQAEGFKLIIRNYSIHNLGELDVVMEKDDNIYVIEVKSRRINCLVGSQENAVTEYKRRRIYKTTEVLIDRYGLFDRNIYFLVGCVTHTKSGLIQNVEIIPF